MAECCELGTWSFDPTLSWQKPRGEENAFYLTAARLHFITARAGAEAETIGEYRLQLWSSWVA